MTLLAPTLQLFFTERMVNQRQASTATIYAHRFDAANDERTGILARSGRPDALADALERLIVSPELRAQIGRAGQERYMEEYTTAAMRRRFFASLEDVVQRRR